MVAALVLAVLAAGCSSGGGSPARTRRDSPRRATTSAPSSVAFSTSTTVDAAVEVPYRVVDRTGSAPGFAAAVDATLHDPRGWQRAGFRLVHRDDAPFAVVLSSADDAQALCRPYDVYRKYSCQNGPLVVVNVDRWRAATPEWTGDVATYRQMLVNHEFGHLLGMHHPAMQCPAPGRPAPVMAQQSTELDGCLPNPWPLDDEIARAARHDLPLAPPYQR